MGARAEQQLALSFLTVLMRLWEQAPVGDYKVEEVDDDLVPALAQMCIKALASDIRDAVPHEGQSLQVLGELRHDNDTVTVPTLRDIANKVVHGDPERIEVRDDDVRLVFVNRSGANAVGRRRGGPDWTECSFSGTSVADVLSTALYKHRGKAQEREAHIQEFLETLGVDRFLPSRIA